MDFLTSTILSGVAWDGIKKFGSISGEYIKSKLTQWLIDDTVCENIAKKINDIPEEYKKNKKILEGMIDEDEELVNILKSIKPNSSYIQNNSGSYNVDSNIANGSGNNMGNTYNITMSDDMSLKEQFNKLKSENEKLYNMLLNEKKKVEDINLSKEEYKTLSGNINVFLQCISAVRLANIWRRASADSSQESSSDFLKDTAKISEEIEQAFNNICLLISEIDDEILINIKECRDDAIIVMNGINDLKMSAWQLTSEYKEGINLFTKGLSKKFPSKEDIFRNIGYDVNIMKEELIKYEVEYNSLKVKLEQFLRNYRNRINI